MTDFEKMASEMAEFVGKKAYPTHKGGSEIESCPQITSSKARGLKRESGLSITSSEARGLERESGPPITSSEARG